MLDSFTTIEITRLRSLNLHDTLPLSLLKPSIRHLHLRTSFSDVINQAVDDGNILSRAYHLCSLDLTAVFLPAVPKMVRLLGRLDQLVQLRTICIKVYLSPASERTDPVEWQELDVLLNGLPALATVNMYPRYRSIPLDSKMVLASMPVLAGRGVLHIHAVHSGQGV
ncbi:hypothetical protein B0H17DRAFT_1211657 [Mycena rosella]|uniref:F-box domain-containing protein n=1 Tax=Mycena rosella TaxID=1033263 RepID=A0AAD7CUJ3_MYCRO|nr:hypothetical protein B0H17DRAFT_1211657 [Mycena rosella]